MDEDQLDATEPENQSEHQPEIDQPDATGRLGVSGFAIVCAALIIAAAIGITGWMLRPQTVQFSQTYQAVLLSNGQFFFGRLQGYGTGNPVLTEVYYVQSTVNPETKQPSNMLLKRGKEWHGPDRMYLNPQHIVMVEPVDPNSRVGQLIQTSKAQK